MKTLSIIIAAALLAIAASSPAQTARPAPKATPKVKTTATPAQRVGDISNPEAEKQPFVGMTKGAGTRTVRRAEEAHCHR